MVQKMSEDLMDGPGVVETTEVIAGETIKEVVEPTEEAEIPVCPGVI